MNEPPFYAKTASFGGTKYTSSVSNTTKKTMVAMRSYFYMNVTHKKSGTSMIRFVKHLDHSP
jgi:hypothetical protein